MKIHQKKQNNSSSKQSGEEERDITKIESDKHSERESRGQLWETTVGGRGVGESTLEEGTPK